MQRRLFFMGLRGAAIVIFVAADGVVWRARDQGVFSVGAGPAYEPWKDWRNSANDGPLALVRAAILAASPHNTQPWLFKVTNSSIELYMDARRNRGRAALMYHYEAGARKLIGWPSARLLACPERVC